MGFLITLEAPTKKMNAEALRAGKYEPINSFLKGFTAPKIQIRTIEQLINGENFNYPYFAKVSKKADRLSMDDPAEQQNLI